MTVPHGTISSPQVCPSNSCVPRGLSFRAQQGISTAFVVERPVIPSEVRNLTRPRLPRRLSFRAQRGIPTDLVAARAVIPSAARNLNCSRCRAACHSERSEESQLLSLPRGLSFRARRGISLARNAPKRRPVSCFSRAFVPLVIQMPPTHCPDRLHSCYPNGILPIQVAEMKGQGDGGTGRPLSDGAPATFYP